MEPPKVDRSSSPVRGFIYQLLGWGMFISAGVISLAGPDIGDEMVLVVLGLAFGGGYLLLRGRRYATKIGSQVIANDHRPPIIYLRSFSEENLEDSFLSYIKAAFTGRQISGDVPSWGPVEQYLLEQFFSKIGPYVAIGQPGQPIPHAGAARIYYGDDEWRQGVIDIFDKARLVVIRAGQTAGLQWELEQLIKHVPARKILLILTWRRADYKTLKAWADSILPKPLPDAQPSERLIMFGDDWSPIPLKMEYGLAQTLAPLLSRNNIEAPHWKPSHMPRWKKGD